MQKGYLRIPRALFMSEAWRKATHEQRSVFIDLCFRVAFVEHEIDVNKMNVHIGVGQVAMSQKDMMREWGVTRRHLRTVLAGLIDLELIATNVATKGYQKITVLTINALADVGDQGKPPKNDQSLKEEGNNNKGIPPKKDPPGGVFHDEDSDDSIKGDKALKKTLSAQIEASRNEMADKWRGYLADENDASAKKMQIYLPYNTARLCNTPGVLEKIHLPRGIPRVADSGLEHMGEYFQFRVLEFVYKSGLRTKMHVDALLQLADTLRHRCLSLNLAQVTYFFYLLENPNGKVGKLEWKGWFDSDKVCKALSCYLGWVSSVG